MPVPSLRPWRSVWLARAVTAVLLVAGLPLFLRMPLWCDLTLYDLAARNLLTGGRHYHEVFDTNLPGFVWALAAVRWVFGFGAFSLRCVDLAIVAGVVLLIDRVAKRGGATPAARWWVFAGAAALYPFAVEMAHCQRDTWMTLPVMAAVLLRVKRAATPTERPFLLSLAEGALWASAVWIKPHVVLMAAAVWLFTAKRVADGSPRPWRAFALDLAGNLAGGLIVGGAGMAYLVGSGTWPRFWEILNVWGPEYTELSARELEWRWDQELHWFPGWSPWLLPTLVLALLSVLDSAPWVRPAPDDRRPGLVGRVLPGWLWDREATSDARFARAALAVLWGVWAFQSFYIQRGFMYVHMAETFLMMGLWASHRWSLPFVVLLWLALTSCVWLVADNSPAVRQMLVNSHCAEHEAAEEWDRPETRHHFVRHPLFDPSRMKHWPDCFRTNLTDRERFALWDEIKRIKDHEASPGWVELDQIAEYLRSRGVKPGDDTVIAWHDSPHALYLTMGLEPGIPFMHINTAVIISERSRAEVMGKLYDRMNQARFAVSDLGWAALIQDPETRQMMLAGPEGPRPTPHPMFWLGPVPVFGWYPSLYPPRLKNWMRWSFPFNQRGVFRSTDSQGRPGRYIVHEIEPGTHLGDQVFPPDVDPRGWPGKPQEK